MDVPRAPLAETDAATRSTKTQAVGAASSAAVEIAIEGPTNVYMVCDQDAFIGFGDASVGAASSSDWPLFRNEIQKFKLVPGENYFRVIRSTADGTLKYFLSRT